MLLSAIKDRLCLNGEEELYLDRLPGGVSVIRKANCRTRFQDWLAEQH